MYRFLFVNENIVVIITAYLVVMSIAGFAAMGIDKHRAVRKNWRIPEKTLLIIAFLGGGIGALLGMYLFRHKTRHMKFVLLVPLAGALYIACLLKIYHIL